METREDKNSDTNLKKKFTRTSAQTAALMAILILCSKFLGFLREMVMAGFFGTSYITDAYVMALAIPGMIFMGFFGAIDTAFMPLFSKTIETQGEKAGNRFTSETLNIGLFVALISAIIGILFSDQIVSIFASGFSGEKAQLTSLFLKVTFSYAIFTSISGLLEAFLRYKGVFLIPIMVGYLQNAIIIGVIIFSAYHNYYLLSWGWFLAYLIRIIIVWMVAKRKKFTYEFTVKIGETAKKIMLLSFPVFIGSYINQINIFVDKSLASRLSVGSVSALNYSNLLVGIITGLTITIIITVIYPKMAQAYSLKSYDYFNDMISTGFNLILIVAIPCSIGAMLYSEQIVQVVYERGAFVAASTSLTSVAFFYYSMGIVFISLNSLFMQTFYSIHDMKTPMIYGMIGVIINIVLNLILVRYLALGGLALATSIAAMCNAVLLYSVARKKYPNIRIVKSKMKIIKILVASIISIAFSWIIYYFIGGSIWLPRMVLLGIAVICAMVLYLIMLKVFKIEELSLIKLIFKDIKTR